MLEHPALTYAWEAHGLQRPSSKGGWLKSCQVAQAAYGRRARKLTWLLYCGKQPPPDLDWSVPPVNAVVTLCGNGRKLLPGQTKLSHREANATPTAFADLLIALAQHSRTTRST